MSSTRIRRALASVAVGAAVASALSGCGVAGTNYQPGIAATIGSRTVTTNDVDRLSTGVCGAFTDQLVQGNEVVPLRFFKTGIVQSLALAAAVEQLGEQYDVTAGDQYRRQVTGVKNDAVDLSADETEALVVARTTQDLVQDIFGQVGAKIGTATARENGLDVKDAAPAAASDEALKIGSDAFAGWLKSHETDIDPQYGVELGVFPQSDGSLSYVKDTDSSVSFGVSDAAKAGALAEPDPAATMKLPPEQRCGTYAAGGNGAGTIPGPG